MQGQSNTNKNQNKCSLCKGQEMIIGTNGIAVKCPNCFVGIGKAMKRLDDFLFKNVKQENLKDIETEVEEKLKELKKENKSGKKNNGTKKIHKSS